MLCDICEVERATDTDGKTNTCDGCYKAAKGPVKKQGSKPKLRLIEKEDE